jgi:hypothetical protein
VRLARVFQFLLEVGLDGLLLRFEGWLEAAASENLGKKFVENSKKIYEKCSFGTT